MRLTGRHILITGGTSGIGAALAIALIKRGNAVAISGRREARLKEMAQRLPGLKTCAADLSKDEGRRKLFCWAEHEMPELNMLVNNAGIQRDINFTKGLGEYLSGESEIEINLRAPIELVGLFAPQLTKQPQAVIINVSSGLGFVPAAAMPVYSATKAGMHAFTLAIRQQFQGLIKVVEIVPPAVDTELNPAGRSQRGGVRANPTAEEFVEGILPGLESDAPEIGFGMTAGLITASRPELDARFKAMNKSG
jgi:uncharacterized oxidoreductase